MSFILFNDDCLTRLKQLEENSVDSIVTDPPYGLSFMGKKWDYDVPSEEIWAECLRVLKPGGHMLAFAGTRTQHRMAVRIEDAGFEIRDMIAWVYGSGFPKSHNLKDEWQGWGTALKPALEPITVARKPLIGTVAENVLAHGNGALNIDGCRVGEGVLRSTGAASREREDGWGMNGGVIGGSELGRWPANLIHDGSDEVVGLFPHTQSGSVKPYEKSTRQGNAYGKQPEISTFERAGDKGSAARFFYCAKASKRDRDEGLEGMPLHDVYSEAAATPMRDQRERSKRANNHPTVKPTDLMRYLCRLVTPPNGVVLDPFMGSGSTGKAAMLEGFQFIGIEREFEYVEIAKARIQHALDNQEKSKTDTQLGLDLYEQ